MMPGYLIRSLLTAEQQQALEVRLATPPRRGWRLEWAEGGSGDSGDPWGAEDVVLAGLELSQAVGALPVIAPSSAP